jgi:mRNA interferase MazF
VQRGELYRVRRPPGDPKPARTFVVVSRQAVIDSKFSTVLCAPVFTAGDALDTQVPVGIAEGLEHESSILCDGLVSLEKSRLTDYVGVLPPSKRAALDQALRIALDLPAVSRS